MPEAIQLKAVLPQPTVILNTDLNHSIEKQESYSLQPSVVANVKLDGNWQNLGETNRKTKMDETAQPKLSHNFLRIPVHPNATPFIQPKLVVNTPGDMYEQEADAIAEKVMSMPGEMIDAVQSAPVQRVHRKCATCGKEEEGEQEEMKDQEDGLLQRMILRKCAACEEEDKNNVLLQRKGNSAGVPSVTLSVEKVLQTPGQPIDTTTRIFMEQRFGVDFGKVRIHDDSNAHHSAREIKALAYTLGNHIVFGEGQLQQGSDIGKTLLAHELTHVLQQNSHSSQILQRSESGAASPTLPEWSKGFVRRIQRSLRGINLFEGSTTGVLDHQTVRQLDTVLSDWRTREKEWLLAYLKLKVSIKEGIELQEETDKLIDSTDEDRIEEDTAAPVSPSLDCDIAKKEFILAYEGLPGKERCMDIMNDVEYNKDYFDSNISSVIGYSVEGTTWENVDYTRFDMIFVKYRNGTSEFFSLDQIPDYRYSGSSIILDFEFLKRSNGLIYPVKNDKIYFSDGLTPKILAYKNGLKYQIKELQDLYELLQVAGAFASIIGSYGLPDGFKSLLKSFRRAQKVPKAGDTLDAPVAPKPPSPVSVKPKIISKTYQYSGRKIVIVELPSGKKQAFYLRYNDSSRAAGHVGAKVGEWAPFDGFKPLKGGGGHFVKDKYFKVDGTDPLYSYGTEENRVAAKHLDTLSFPDSEVHTEFGSLNDLIKASGAPAPWAY